MGRNDTPATPEEPRPGQVVRISRELHLRGAPAQTAKAARAAEDLAALGGTRQPAQAALKLQDAPAFERHFQELVEGAAPPKE
eukprot:2968363-Alexandrium_andersonii.AAC.1